MNQELQEQYSPSHWNKRMSEEEVVKSHVKDSKEGTLSARQSCRCELDVPYGEGARQKYDVYYPKGSLQEDAPVFVYIHGGYWQIQEISKDNGGFMAETFTGAGCIVVGFGYPLAPDSSLPDIIESARLGVKAIQKKFPKSRIFLCGHSAGAHLAAMVVCSGDAVGPVEGVFLVSGVFDVVPLLSTDNNDLLKMNEQTAVECSPLKYASKFPPTCKAIVIVGEHESPAFKEQKAAYAKALQKTGVAHCEEIEVPQVDHFNLAENLRDPGYELTQKILSIILKQD
ncbi:kynurenine formamidase-like isoform X2 [Oscarella lobularis]|uniref:kynurenine formamidase-like isoform X2 n=1 Tax=Oscarella lobularis TaxID=121494 RepID=UPI0033137E12